MIIFDLLTNQIQAYFELMLEVLKAVEEDFYLYSYEILNGRKIIIIRIIDEQPKQRYFSRSF